MIPSNFKVITFVLILFVTKVHANLPEDPNEYSAWESKILQSIETKRTLPNDESIPRLGEWVMQLTLSNNLEKGNRPAFHAAQLALLAIPGHAEYYRDRVLKAQADYRDEVISEFSGAMYNDYISEQATFLKTLGQLPSPETVRVLGEFLSDDWIRPNSPNSPTSPMSLQAVLTFARLPLAAKPADTRFDHEAKGDLLAWRSWYAKIKSGNRTFRFEGDPTEYALEGPASKVELERIAKSRERDEKRTTGLKRLSSIPDGESTVTGISKPSMIAGVLASCGLVAVAVWYFFRGKRTA